MKIIYYLCPTIEFFNKNKTKMKKGIHPENYRLVAFKDMSNDHVFLCRSAVSTKETIEVNGETYPVYKMEISNTSHPFYTGKMKLVDTAGRVDKFMSRYAKRYDKEERCEISIPHVTSSDASVRFGRKRLFAPPMIHTY